LTLTLSVSITVTSALNAIAHAAEGLYAHDGNPVVALMAEEGIRACAAVLPPLQADPKDLAARTDALYGAWLCGIVLGSVAMGLHHKLCHTLGGSFNLPHAQTHSVILPHALAYNAAAAPQAMARIAKAIGVASGEDAALGVQHLARCNGAPTSLADIGLVEEDLDRAAAIATAQPYRNPSPITQARLRLLLQDAFDGAPPGTRTCA
jgi:maleylacetate reductase